MQETFLFLLILSVLFPLINGQNFTPAILVSRENGILESKEVLIGFLECQSKNSTSGASGGKIDL